MSDAAKKDDEKPVMVEIPLERLERLLKALEYMVQRDQRAEAQRRDTARRAEKKAGPTTQEAEERVRRKLRKMGMG